MQHLPPTREFGLFVRSPAPPTLTGLWLLLAGLGQAASISWPFGDGAALGLVSGQPVWWLQWVCLAVLAQQWLRGQHSATKLAALSWLYGTAWLSASFAWLYVSMHTYGGLPAALAALAVLVLAAALALYHALGGWIMTRLAPPHLAWRALLFASLWLAAELARGTWLTGFGWAAIGYAQLDGPLQPLVPWLGVYGTGFAAALLAALLAALWHEQSARSRLGLAVGALLLLGGVRLLPAPDAQTVGAPLGVALLQGNIAQDEKFDAHSGVPQALDWYARQLRLSTASLSITPETAVPLLPLQLAPDYLPELQQHLAASGRAALVGIPLGNAQQGYTNSVLGLQPQQTRFWRYDKHHLVPFGEFIPPLARWFTDLMHIPLGDFDRGALAQPTFDWQGQRISASICYENLFGEELAAQFRQPHTSPTLLVNISNLAWFGDSLAMAQNLSISRMRAIEFNRPFLLVTNTGQTAVIDANGQVVQRLPAHQAGVLRATVQGRSSRTVYTQWVARWGLWPLWGAVLALLALGAWWRGVWLSRQKVTSIRPGHHHG